MRNGRLVHLSDGGLSDPLPFEFARAKGIGATHLIVSDCRRIAGEAPTGPNLAYIRPELNGAASFRSPAGGMGESIRRGEQACTADILATISNWIDRTPRVAAV